MEINDNLPKKDPLVRIHDLEKILKDQIFGGMRETGIPCCPGGGDGHSFNDEVEIEKVPYYIPKYSERERETAKTELEKLYNDSDKEIRQEAGKVLGYSNLRRKLHELRIG